MKDIKGNCLCGAVTVQARGEGNMGACHCGICRKWGGGPFLCAEAKDVTWQGDAQIGVYASSDWAERGFCKHCGTHLFYRMKDSSFYAISAGVVDPEGALVFDHQVFIDRKPGNYAFANQTQNLTEAQVFAMFGAK